MTRLHTTILIVSLSFVLIAGCEETRRPISPDRPLIIVPWTAAGARETLDQIDPQLRPLVALQTRGVSSEKGRQAFVTQCEGARAAGVPMAIHVRTHWPVETEADYESKVSPPDAVAEMLDRFDNIVAVIVAEQYNFSAEQRDYLLRVMKLCEERGVYCIFDAGWHSGASWVEFGIDPVLSDAAKRCRRTFVPMWEMNISSGMFSEHAELMGLWLGGLCDHWGVNPQTWYWGEAGFGDLGQNFDWRCAKAGGMAKGLEVRKHFPFYGQMVSLPAITGASVYWIGGELPPHVWDKEGKPSFFWTQTLDPVLKFIVDQRVIPDREGLRKSAKAKYVNRTGQPYIWDRAVARSGLCSVRIDCGAGRSVHLGWKTDIPIRPAPERTYELSGWIKCDGLDGEAGLDAAWFDGKRWTHRTTDKVSGTTAWKRLGTSFDVPEGARFFLVALRSDAACGKVWFDEVCMKEEKGENILPNADFEMPRLGGARPSGWAPGGGYGPADTERCSGGINALWKPCYSMSHRAEFLPNDGMFFPIISLPALSSEGTSTPHPTTHKIHPNAAPVLRVGECVMVANSHENMDRDQAVSCMVGNVTITGALPVHSYFVIRETADGWVMFVEGRSERTTSLKLASSTGFRVVVVRGDVQQAREANGVSLQISHSKTKAAVVKLIRE